MIAIDIIKYLENWAPRGAAWEKDNVGLQVGNPNTKIKNIFLTLELTGHSLKNAVKNNCNFIFTHHPLIFRPLYRLDIQNDPKAKLIEQIVKHDLVVYSAHTNLDFTKDGVSFQLAKKLKLQKIKFLVNEKENQYKLTVFVPENFVETVSNAIFEAGGGIIGEYQKCSFRINGKGTFFGSENTNPNIGSKGSFEQVDEIRVEFLVNSWSLNAAINSMLKAHPYEEPAYDVYKLNNKNVNYGFGAIGELKKPLPAKKFLDHVCEALNTKNLRYTKGKKNLIKRVAVCGGSGSDLLNDAISQNADAFVTADIKYHTFQDGENKILFIDAGHYETEVLSLSTVKSKLEKFIRNTDEPVKVIKYAGSTNPIRYYNKKGEK